MVNFHSTSFVLDNILLSYASCPKNTAFLFLSARNKNARTSGETLQGPDHVPSGREAEARQGQGACGNGRGGRAQGKGDMIKRRGGERIANKKI